ncbi:MAG: DUF1178 family protein [Pseudomonadota bacterium]
MIIYDLICDANHEFEGWFKDADDMSSQQAGGLLTCPLCDSANVSKKLTAPKLNKKSNSLPASSSATQEVAIAGGQSPEKFAQLQEMLGKVHDYIEQNFTDVGNRFAEEAISIHRGEKDAANIRGTASQEQLEEMAEEGVAAVPLPPKPIDRKKIN